MKNKGITMTLVFEGESSNYGEGFGNVSSLKKITRQGGDAYSYISRQALRYNIVEQMGWNNTPVEASGKGDKKVIQFAPQATIQDYPEIDLFGYMKTEAKKDKKDDSTGATTRNAVVRLSNAISLEPYNADTDFLTNLGLANRLEANGSIVQSEIHKSFYSYTVTIDLEEVGVDREINLPEEEKKKRVKELLKTIQFLYRDIRGRRENLSPIFAIGGIYDRKTPFFENRIYLTPKGIKVEVLKDILSSDPDIEKNTKVGYLDGSFANSEEIKEKLNTIKINEFFNSIIKKMEEEC